VDNYRPAGQSLRAAKEAITGVRKRAVTAIIAAEKGAVTTSKAAALRQPLRGWNSHPKHRK
jgi:hypothetical protein